MIIECALWIAAILCIVFESSRYNIPKKCATYFVKYVKNMSRPALKNVTSYVSVTLGWAFDVADSVFVTVLIFVKIDCPTIQCTLALPLCSSSILAVMDPQGTQQQQLHRVGGFPFG